MPRKKKLPRYVVLKTYKGVKSWHVRRTFRTDEFYENGKRVYLEFTAKCEPETAERAAEVAEELVKLYEEQKQRTEAKTNDPTVSVYLSEYLEIIRHSLARRTFEDYSELHDRYIKKSIGKIKLAELTPMEVQKTYSGLGKRGISGSVVKKLHSFLFQALKQAVKWRKLAHNPAEDAILPKIIQTDKAVMSKQEIKTLINHCRSSAKNTVFWFALETGFRPGEYLALRWSDIDLDNRTVKLDRAVSFARSGGDAEFKELKTSFSRRSVKITEGLARALRALKEQRETEILELKDKILHYKNVKTKFTPLKTRKSTRGGIFSNQKKRARIIENTLEHLKNIKEFDLVFPAAKGKPKSMLNLNNREFKDALKACQIEHRKFSLYSLRHTCLTEMSQILTPKELQNFAGHASITTTLKFYVHASDDAKSKASNAWSELID